MVRIALIGVSHPGNKWAMALPVMTPLLPQMPRCSMDGFQKPENSSRWLRMYFVRWFIVLPLMPATFFLSKRVACSMKS